jgi:hypothetical protein
MLDNKLKSVIELATDVSVRTRPLVILIMYPCIRPYTYLPYLHILDVYIIYQSVCVHAC